MGSMGPPHLGHETLMLAWSLLQVELVTAGLYATTYPAGVVGVAKGIGLRRYKGPTACGGQTGSRILRRWGAESLKRIGNSNSA
jgi:hypothetical protein